LMELTIFELGCENNELFLKEGRDGVNVPNGETVWHQPTYY